MTLRNSFEKYARSKPATRAAEAQVARRVRSCMTWRSTRATRRSLQASAGMRCASVGDGIGRGARSNRRSRWPTRLCPAPPLRRASALAKSARFSSGGAVSFRRRHCSITGDAACAQSMLCCWPPSWPPAATATRPSAAAATRRTQRGASRARDRAAQRMVRRALRGAARLLAADEDAARPQGRLRPHRRLLRERRGRAARMAARDRSRPRARLRSKLCSRPRGRRRTTCGSTALERAEGGAAVSPPRLRVPSDGRGAHGACRRR